MLFDGNAALVISKSRKFI